MRVFSDNRFAVDAVSATTIASCLMGWLPPIGALLGVIWYILQIYGWFERRAFRKRSRLRNESHQ